MIPASDRYWLRNAHVPKSLICREQDWRQDEVTVGQDDLLRLDLEIVNGTIARIHPAEAEVRDRQPAVDLQSGMVFPCFVDLHTHLDKGHIWERCPNPDGTFDSALATVKLDSAQHWNATDVYRRMEFGLKCSYAHGTKAIRTHIDAADQQGDISFEVFQTLRQEWSDRLVLQAACLVSLDYYLTPAGEKLADKVAESGGILGGVAYANPDIDAQIDRAFSLARDRNLALDFHADETTESDSTCLRSIASATTRYHYQNRVVCGHCCSLSTQSPTETGKTIHAVQQAQIGIVSLPLCNLYLQGRTPGRTPRWRGVTLLHELKQAGVPVAISSDNCRDPFHAYGDHDTLEIFSWSTKIAHLDRPHSDWCCAITRTPADLMGLHNTGRIAVGLPADLVLFKARRYSELFSRSQHDRVVLRQGKAIDTTLPPYTDLDDLQLKRHPTSTITSAVTF